MKVAVTWQMCGWVDVPDVETMQEAIDKFDEIADSISLPQDGEYVDGSFELSSYDAEEQEVMANLVSKYITI